MLDVDDDREYYHAIGKQVILVQMILIYLVHVSSQKALLIRFVTYTGTAGAVARKRTGKLSVIGCSEESVVFLNSSHIQCCTAGDG